MEEIDNYNDYFVIFYTENTVNKLKQYNFWCVDGTFTTIPSPYLQLYTISYLIEHQVFPAVYIFMKNRQQETYIDAFNVLNNMIEDLNPNI